MGFIFHHEIEWELVDNKMRAVIVCEPFCVWDFLKLQGGVISAEDTYKGKCYRNPLCGREQQTGATLVVRWLVRAWNLWVHFLFYCIWCCLLFHLDSRLILPGVPLCRFCSSTAKLYPFANHCMSFIFCCAAALYQSVFTFLIWKCPLPDWLLIVSLSFYGCYLLLIGFLTFPSPD